MWRLLVFCFTEWPAIAEWKTKHLNNVTDAALDLVPIVERYRKTVAPDSTTVAKVEDGLRRVVDNANPQQGDMFSPVNPNPNAG